MPVRVADLSPPLAALASGGADVTDQSSEVVPEALGRVKVEVMNAGSARIWLGIGEPAVAGDGNFIDPGTQWYEYTTEAVNALHEDSGEQHRASYQEWAA